MPLTADIFWIVCPLAFLAGFVDSIAGGGGLISLPAYYVAKLPPALAAGTNKLAAAMGTSLATVNYGLAKKIDYQVGLFATTGALVCSALGAETLKRLPMDTVRWVVLVCIPVAAVFTLRGGQSKGIAITWGRARQRCLAVIIGCVIGFYDGLVGPGTGTFLILLFMYAFGHEAVMASGTAKIVNLASNVSALASLLSTGDVLILLGLPAGLCSMAGAFLGSRLTIRKGAQTIRIVMFLVLGLLLVKVLADMI